MATLRYITLQRTHNARSPPSRPAPAWRTQVGLLTVLSGYKTLTTQVRCQAGAVPTSYPTGTNSVKRTANESYTSRSRMCGASPPCLLPVLTPCCLCTGKACQWRILISRSGIAEGYTMRHGTVPLGRPCVSGFATDSSGRYAAVRSTAAVYLIAHVNCI
jgi:hypothetical protein